jgi:hypothetical protein
MSEDEGSKVLPNVDIPASTLHGVTSQKTILELSILFIKWFTGSSVFK